MDFISNLIKRPISLVLNEQANPMDKYSPISASLPTTSKEMENNKDSQVTTATAENLQQSNETNSNNNKQKRPLSMSSSYNGNHMTDFIGVPDEYLDEFKDILPPPPLNLQNHDNLSPFEMDSTRCMSITPPPPPMPLQQQQEEQKQPMSETAPPMTPSMKASQTIDELLSHINDNLQQAGLNDEVLALASPPNKGGELSPLTNKSSLNNSKLLTPSSSASNINSLTKTPLTTTTTAAAGSVNATVFENNSSIHKFHIDPELENAIFNDDHEHHQQDNLNSSGVNKSCNKFVGLTEFDEAKIPELPGDLNPNIEEQYNVTFEECFIPTLTAQQGTTKVPEEFIVDKTHLLLPTESDAISSENETFADCNDDKDPLATTFAENANTLDITTDLESYQSAVNNSINSNLNNTMENIADITMEAVGQPLQKLNETQVVEQAQSENKTQQYQPMDDDEPMDIDMNATMEIIQNTSSNIQHVEKVLQHAENILQHIEDKKYLEEESVSGLLEKQTEQSTKTFMIKSQEENLSLEIEQSKHELSLNKSIELPINKSKTLNSECVIETCNKEVLPDQPNESATAELTESNQQLNVTIDNMNSSTISNTSAKSIEGKTEKKLSQTLGLNTSVNSQKTSAPSSPSFPIKSSQVVGFPSCPKAALKPKESPFLEKSDFIAYTEEKSVNNLNGTFVESASTNNLNGTFVEPSPVIKENDKRLTFGVDTTMPKSLDQMEQSIGEIKNKRQTFSVEPVNEDKTADEKRRTFSVKTNETPSSLMQFPSLDKPDNARRTFAIDESESIVQNNSLNSSKNDMNSRRTFNVSAENLPTLPTAENVTMNTSFEPMDVDDAASHNATMPMPTEGEQRSQSPPLPTLQQRSQSPTLPSIQQRSQSPPLPTMQQRSQSPALPTMQPRSQSPALPAMQPRSQSPAIPTMQQRSHSPALSTMQHRSQSPVLPTMQPRSQSPPLPTMQQRSQSPVLPTMQPRSQSPPLPTMQPKSPAANLPTMQQRSQSPPLPTMQQNKHKNQLPSIPTDFDNINIKQEQISPPSLETASSSTSYTSQPLPTLIQKRPSIRDARARAAEILSAKEQSNIKVKDEKDVFVEKFTPSPIEDIFTAVSATSTTLTNSSGFSEFDQTSSSSISMINNGGGDPQPTANKSQQFEDEFSGNNNHNSNQINKTRTSNSGGLNTFGLTTAAGVTGASAKLLKERSQEVKQLQLEQQIQQNNKRQLLQGINKKNATMSVDVIKDMSLDNDCNKTFENSNSTQSDDKQINNYKMDELEKKIKNEVLKTEDIEKKLKDAEQREEALIKRITEKDKTIAKMTGVIEAYEKAIAELIADKEQITQHYEKQLAEVKADRDSNYHHLTSLETTFSDLHVKYEKSKEMTCQLKESEEALQAEKRKNLENLHLQEQRYDKMKNHAMQQLEIANKKLESLTREHSIEITKLKALLKKEEIARSSINEQLAQKTKENAELVKICDELIQGQGS